MRYESAIRRWQAAFRKLIGTTAKQRILRSLAAFTIVVAPASALAWAGNQNSSSQNRDFQDASQATDQAGKSTDVNSKAHISVNGKSSSSSESSGNTSVSASSNGAHVKLNVNGQDIPVPKNGAVSKTIPGSGGQTSVNISANQEATSSGNASNSSSVNLNISSESSSEQ